ncbi:hypothetical protein GCM10009647_061870 [Streptomyces sanglieri]|uniref:Uncharacterized protein n=1 Tax=Streptomyces sanglieri TaxID=193460 RepID=A0ABW2X4W9_9ACTN|nr:hypothetical protein [Streptomyces sp. Wh19]MDV9196408.1 hypothetical protein [Streptomyces sp. Wh19]
MTNEIPRPSGVVDEPRGRRQCPGVMDHDALSPGVGEGDPAVARVLGVAGAPSRTGKVPRAVVKDRHP